VFVPAANTNLNQRWVEKNSLMHKQSFPGSSSSESPRRHSRLSFAQFATPQPNEADNPYYKGMDAYQILGIGRDAEEGQIKKAFKKLVFQWHTDRVPAGDAAKKKEHELRMIKINWAFYCLKDPERKSRYDKFGEEGVGTSEVSEEQLKAAGGPIPQGFGGLGGGGAGMDGIEIGDIGDLFNAMFGGGMGSGGARGGPGSGPGGGFSSSFFGGEEGGAGGGNPFNRGRVERGPGAGGGARRIRIDQEGGNEGERNHIRERISFSLLFL
jgi:DnaJ-class molecular chaperone